MFNKYLKSKPILGASDPSGSVNWLSDAGNCAEAFALRSLAAAKNCSAMAAGLGRWHTALATPRYPKWVETYLNL